MLKSTDIFQHYNDPKYTADAVKSYPERNTADKTLTVMDWPPLSRDLNIIEPLWEHLDREINKRQPIYKEEFSELLKETWYHTIRLRQKSCL